MKKLILLLFMSLFAYSQSALIPATQDSPELVWRKLENKNFKILYPDYLEKKAKYILNLLEYFREYVGQSYDMAPKKFTLVIRAQMSEPNGFVTLAPRRSEWFSSATLSPFVGSLDWYQALAVHEYRHVVQMDYLKRPNIDIGYALFGEMGLQLLMGWVTPAWYFEGDAVYAETKYTDAGRGRSPRFLARMKALLASGNIPSYDEFIAGNYKDSFPNHYVYGYLLITNAYKRFGKDIWKDIMSLTARKVWNPWSLYNAFENITGMSFENFYRETMDELTQEWDLEINKSDKIYSRIDYPLIDGDKLYFIEKSLDSYWTLFEKKSENKKALTEVNIAPSLSHIDVKNGKFLYSIAFSHPRYQYKGTSDLYLYDIAQDESNQITKDARYYHPRLNPVKDEILAVEFDDKNNWSLSFLNFNGKVIDKINLEKGSITEAIFIDANKLGAIIIDEMGLRSVAIIDRNTKSINTLVGPSRNNFYALAISENGLLFEADFEGAVNIFEAKFSGVVSKCSDEKIAAYRPFYSKGKIYYASEVSNGASLKEISYDCKSMDAKRLSSYKYLGKGPSDNFTNTEIKPIALNKSDISEVEEKAEAYNQFEDTLTPHSWSFIGRGFQLGAYAQNKISTIFLQGAIGESIEQRGYGNLSIGFAKYFPIFSFDIDYAGRKVKYEEENITSTWSEAMGTASMTIPLVFQTNLYQQRLNISFGASHLEVSKRENQASYSLSDEQLQVGSVAIYASNLKQKTVRQINPSYGQSLSLIYQDGQAQEDKSFSSYMSYANAKIYIPGLTTNHSIKLTSTSEIHKRDTSSYRFASPAADPTMPIYSRGYSLGYAPKYTKSTFDYYLPLGYPNKGVADYIFFNRIYANLFYDHTLIDGLSNNYIYKSLGAEFHFESLTFRKLPLIYSFRFYNQLDYDQDGYKGSGMDFYLGTNFDI